MAGAGDRGRDTPGAAKRGTLGWALPGSLAAVGLAGLGVALYTRLQFDSRVDDLRVSCAPECTQQQRSDSSSTLVLSNVALGVGLGALALTVVAWFVTAPPSSSSSVGLAAGSAGDLMRRGFAW